MGKKDKSEKKKEVEDDDDAEDGSKKQVFLSPPMEQGELFAVLLVLLVGLLRWGLWWHAR